MFDGARLTVTVTASDDVYSGRPCRRYQWRQMLESVAQLGPLTRFNGARALETPINVLLIAVLARLLTKLVVADETFYIECECVLQLLVEVHLVHAVAFAHLAAIDGLGVAEIAHERTLTQRGTRILH